MDRRRCFLLTSLAGAPAAPFAAAAQPVRRVPRIADRPPLAGAAPGADVEGFRQGSTRPRLSDTALYTLVTNEEEAGAIGELDFGGLR